VFGAVAVVVMAVAASGSAAPTESTPQIYIGSAPNYTIAFKAEGPSRVSVLALDAPIFCTFLHPTERFPGKMWAFQGPTAMRMVGGQLKATIRPGGGPSSDVTAKLGGGKLSGTFALDQDEGSADCHTGGYKPADPVIKFEAVPYAPAESGVTKPAAKGEVPLYYGDEGGLEVLLETEGGEVNFRGAAPATCPIAGKRPTGGRAPLLSDVEEAPIGNGGAFSRTFRSHGKVGSKQWSEAITISGSAEPGKIAGSYLRTTTIRSAAGPAKQCKVGPLPFSAVRYLPAS
jgi:hypothetical protein